MEAEEVALQHIMHAGEGKEEVLHGCGHAGSMHRGRVVAVCLGPPKHGLQAGGALSISTELMLPAHMLQKDDLQPGTPRAAQGCTLHRALPAGTVWAHCTPFSPDNGLAGNRSGP